MNQSSQLKPNIQTLKPSATLAINERSVALIQQGKTVYRLGFGQSPFPVPEQVVQALRDNAHIKDYLPVKGLPALRKAVAEFNTRTLGITCDAAQIMIGPGSKELIFGVQMAFDAALILPAPSWVSYEPQANIAQNKIIWANTYEKDGWRLTPHQLEIACQKVPNQNKLLIINYPNNPAGYTYTEDEIRDLAAVAKKYEILIISDEIYGEFHFEGKHISLAKYYPEGTIISSGLSKWCGAGGWRIGTFTFPKEYAWLLKAMATIASETFTSVSAPIQYASITAFKGSSAISAYVHHSRRILKSVSYYVHQALADLKITASPAEGGFYLFPNFEHYRSFFEKQGVFTNTELCEWLLEETGVALLPGIAFGRQPQELTTRLSYVDFDGVKALEYAQKYEEIALGTEFIEMCCPQIVNAMKALKTKLIST